MNKLKIESIPSYDDAIELFIENDDIECSKDFIYGIEYALLYICKSLYKQYEEKNHDDAVSLHFCNTCHQVVYYGDIDMCDFCGEEVSLDEDSCPKCKHTEFTPTCSNPDCGAPLDCNYISDILIPDYIDDLCIEDYNTIKDYLLNKLIN